MRKNRKCAQPRSSQEQPEAAIEASSPSVVRQGLEGYAKALARLDGIPGINRRVAEIVLAEIGINMEQFPSDGHLASWAGMCPGSKVSAGKRLSGKTTKGSAWLRAALLEAAHGASHSKQSYLGEQYRRLARRKGREKGACCGRPQYFGHYLSRPQGGNDLSRTGEHLF